MTIHKDNTPRKKYLIEELLNNVRGSKSELARDLWIWQWAVNHFFNTWARTLSSQKKYTKVFNECFETNYSYKELFSLVDNK